MLDLLPFVKQFRSPVIAMVGNLSSPLTEAADYVLDASVMKEAADIQHDGCVGAWRCVGLHTDARAAVPT